jgi:hypothetical protein
MHRLFLSELGVLCVGITVVKDGYPRIRFVQGIGFALCLRQLCQLPVSSLSQLPVHLKQRQRGTV